MSQRLSRWSDEPRVRDGRVRTVTPSVRETEIVFPILQRYGALPVNYIHALMGAQGGSLDYLGDRLPLLACKPNCYLLRHPAQRQNADGNYRFQVYSHADAALKDFWHDLMAAMVMAQIEIGANADPGIDYADFARILAKAPEPLRRAKNPAAISIEFRPPTGKPHPVTIVADWAPFAIGRGGKFRFYFGIEADRHHETIRAGRLHHSSIRRKMLEYLQVNERKVAQRVYGLPGPFYFPFVFDLKSRIDRAQELLLDLTKGKGSPHFLFNSFPSYNSYETPPPPDGALFRSTWRRAGYPDFRMDEV